MINDSSNLIMNLKLNQFKTFYYEMKTLQIYFQSILFHYQDFSF